MAKQLKVFVAVDTPLYCPIFLALCVEPRLRDVVKIVPAASMTRPSVDWFHNVLHSSEWAVGVGDPMRLSTLVNASEKAEVLAVLIDKMCFWIVDHAVDVRWHELGRLLVHPRGMTAFTVVAHDLSKLISVGTVSAFDALASTDVAVRAQAIDELNRRLHDSDVNPNQEKEAYLRHVLPQDRRQGWVGLNLGSRVKPTGFVTANPAYVKDPGLTKLHCFTQDHKDVVMTAVIGRREVGSAERSLRTALLEAVSRSMEWIHSDPELCAAILWKGWHQVSGDSTARPHGFVDSKAFAETLQWLVQNGIYNERPSLKVPASFVDKTCKLRESVSPLLSTDNEKTPIGEIQNMMSSCVEASA